MNSKSATMHSADVLGERSLRTVGILLGILFLLTSPHDAVSQSQQLAPLDSVLSKEMLIGNLKWESIALEVGDEEPMEVSEAIERVNNMSTDKLRGYPPSSIVDLVSEFKLYCGEVGYFMSGFGLDDPDIPSKSVVRFFEKDGEDGILVSKLFGNSVYNTNVTTHEERLEERVKSCILPKIKPIHESLNDTSIDYYGISHFYGAEDPSDYGSPSAEMIVVVIPKNVASNFSSGEITDEDMMESSEVYVKRSDMTAEYIRTSVDL